MQLERFTEMKPNKLNNVLGNTYEIPVSLRFKDVARKI